MSREWVCLTGWSGTDVKRTRVGGWGLTAEPQQRTARSSSAELPKELAPCPTAHTSSWQLYQEVAKKTYARQNSLSLPPSGSSYVGLHGISTYPAKQPRVVCEPFFSPHLATAPKVIMSTQFHPEMSKARSLSNARQAVS